MKKPELIALTFVLIMAAITFITSFYAYQTKTQIVPNFCDPASTSFHFQIENMDFYQSATTPFMLIER